MNRADLTSDQLGAFASGLLDVLYAFSIVLERRGLLARTEIAEALAEGAGTGRGRGRQQHGAPSSPS
jgi:hypothetical protein